MCELCNLYQELCNTPRFKWTQLCDAEIISQINIQKVDTKALEEKWNQTKEKLEQKVAVLTIGHQYINDWDQGRETDLFYMKTWELYNSNQKFCNTIWY